MKHLLRAALVGVLLSPIAAAASVLDFSSSPAFDSTFTPINTPDSTTITVDGVTFTVTSIESRGAEGFRQNTVFGGLNFGVPGNGMNEMSISASEDIFLEAFTGFDSSIPDPGGAINGPLSFDAFIAGGASVVSDFSFAAAGSSVDLGDTLLSAGTVLNFFTDYTTTTGFSARIGATLQTLQFSAAAPVPLPAGLPLLLMGLGAFAWMRRQAS